MSGPAKAAWGPRLVALDVDGTLVDHDGRLPTAIGEAVDLVVAAGVPVVLCTGRSWHGTKPLVDEGPFAYTEVNVARQRGSGDSLLTWTQRLINVRRECPETGEGTLTLVDGEGVPPEVLAHRIDGTSGSLLFLHNLSDAAAVVDVTKTSGLDDAGDV